MRAHRIEPYIEAINLAKKQAILSNGEYVPITTYVDIDGEETDDHEIAITFVCGSDLEGWFVDYLCHFAEMEMH